MRRRLRKVLRVVYKVLIFPVILIVAPLYKLKRYLQNKKTNIVYADILDGFANYTFPNEKAEALAKKRAAICSKCPFVRYSGIVNTVSVGENIKEVKGMYCDVCGCGLSAKIRSLADFCPRSYW